MQLKDRKTVVDRKNIQLSCILKYASTFKTLLTQFWIWSKHLVLLTSLLPSVRVNPFQMKYSLGVQARFSPMFAYLHMFVKAIRDVAKYQKGTN